MPFVPVNGVALVELRYLLDNQHIENTLYFETGDGVDAANLLLLLNAVESWWLDNMAALVPDAVTLVELVATDLTTATGPQVSVAPTGGDPGTVADPVLPNNVTIAISFRTAQRGRSFRGRNYHPALWETGVIKNTVQDTIVAAIQDAYTALIGNTDVLGAGYTWVVVSRFSGVDADGDPIPRVAGIATAITSVLIVDPIIDSQRRRLPGRGR